MSIETTARPEVEEPRGVFATLAAKTGTLAAKTGTLAAKTDLRPHVRQASAEITARVCATLPVAAVLTAATGMATGAFILLRHAVGQGHGHRR